MSISDVKRSFSSALGSKANCTRATMAFELNDVSGRKEQRVSFHVVPKGGAAVAIVSELVPSDIDLVVKAREMAESYIATLED